MELGGHFYDVVNKFWAEVIWKEFISRNEKALIWAGSCHTPTRFRIDRRPRLEHYISAGNFIYNFIENRAIYIALHAASCYGDIANAPVSDFIEALMKKVSGAKQGAGFDTVGTPFGDLLLPDEIKGWSAGKTAGFMMRDLCDGYVYLVPRAEFESDTPMDLSGIVR